VEQSRLTAALRLEVEPGAALLLTEQQNAARRLASLAEEVRGAFDYLPASLAGNMAGMSVIGLLFWGVNSPRVMTMWIVAFVLMLLARVVLGQRFKRSQPTDERQWAFWRRAWNLGTLSSAAMWGATAWVFYPGGQSIQQIGLIITIYTLSVAVVPVLATQPTVFLAFGALCFLPMAARIASEGTTYGYELAGILVLVFALTTVLARSYRQALRRAIDLKLLGDSLTAQLQVEKRAAEDARKEADNARIEADDARVVAEVANRAKTQFFTAASHDLRQPLHAMGLFAEALRQKNHDGEVAHLVNSINESVDALEGLFSELLDITRIDSGGVEVHPEHFSMGDILRKLRLHFEPVAFEKGLALRLRGGQHMVHADPLLVERILRNLVSNAIRYTPDGTVLVSCRRKGDSVLLQVWDSGLGISEEQQARVFEEFYQVPSSKKVGVHERKGLGLGLAIVKRLVDLLHAPLKMQSQLGRGTVFSLTLPAGKAARQAMPAFGGTSSLKLTLQNRLIVVVEDEPAVLAGLEAVLKSWGATLAAFSSVSACLAWAKSADAAQARPDLLIVDFRLEDGHTGVEVITSLRAQFKQRIPAIVVTGSTMTGHEQEAQELDFHLLIKPVVPNKLRAMIAFKLGVKGG
jgi:two-component system, sensor histidine kinase